MSTLNSDISKIFYIHDNKLQEECDRLPTMNNRASIVQDLIEALDLLNDVCIRESVDATEDDLKLCHSTAYINFLKILNDLDDFEEYDEVQLEFGLGYDCPILEQLYDFVRTVAGASLTAAKYLMNEECKIAINWFGGWHHAQRDSAAGFCYVNDVAIAIQKMSEKFERVLYIDFDIHHGDGVQNLFELSTRILTLSFHKCVPGFYPGTGTLTDLGYSKGKYYSLNVPFLEGLSDKSLLYTFQSIFPRINEVFQPQAIVIQCGADGIRGDPTGECNLTPKSVGECVQNILDTNVPLLFLGGGGYNFANSARYWAFLTSVIVKQKLPTDVPDDCTYFTEYGPDFELQITPGRLKDTNSKQYLDTVIETILEYCQHIQI